MYFIHIYPDHHPFVVLHIMYTYLRIILLYNDVHLEMDDIISIKLKLKRFFFKQAKNLNVTFAITRAQEGEKKKINFSILLHTHTACCVFPGKTINLAKINKLVNHISLHIALDIYCMEQGGCVCATRDVKVILTNK